MYRVIVTDRFMIAHSFKGEVFGPAQRLHGATYVVTVEFAAESLDENGIVVDIARAQEALSETFEPFAYRNLDTVKRFDGQNTTTEVLAKVIFDDIAVKIAAGELGPHSSALKQLKVTLAESDVAFASYEGNL